MNKLIAILWTGACAGLWVTGCAAEPARAASLAPPRVVQVVKAERSDRPVTTEVVGTVRAVRSATVAALISGKVVEVRVGLGTSVRAGEVLVRLSDQEVAARLEQTKQALALAQLERDRSINLRSQQAISASQYDASVSAWNIAQARNAEARSIAEHTVIRAPFAGMISAKLTNVGDTAMPGQPLLIIEAPGAVRFEARVPEAVADGLAIGDSAAVRLDGFDRDLAGAVVEIQPAADDTTRTRLVKLDLPATRGLRSGRFGRLLISTGASLAVRVPSAAVVRHGQLEGVFVAESGIARLRLVRSGREQDDLVEITSGLSGDEQVIVSTPSELLDGQRIEVTP